MPQRVSLIFQNVLLLLWFKLAERFYFAIKYLQRQKKENTDVWRSGIQWNAQMNQSPLIWHLEFGIWVSVCVYCVYFARILVYSLLIPRVSINLQHRKQADRQKEKKIKKTEQSKYVYTSYGKQISNGIWNEVEKCRESSDYFLTSFITSSKFKCFASLLIA